MTLSYYTLITRIKYLPFRGDFYWRAKDNDLAFNKRFAGKPAGSVNKIGYRNITINGKTYSAARLAYFYMTRELIKLVDHKDRNPRNNRWSNLRKADARENVCNRTFKKKGIRGVTFIKNKWIATVYYQSKAIRLGSYDQYADAVLVRRIGAKYVYGLFSTQTVSFHEYSEHRVLIEKILRHIDTKIVW